MYTIEEQKEHYRNTKPPASVPYYPEFISETLDSCNGVGKVMTTLVTINRDDKTYVVLVSVFDLECIENYRNHEILFHQNVKYIQETYIPRGLEWDVTEPNTIGTQPMSAEEMLPKFRDQPIQFANRMSNVLPGKHSQNDPVENPAHYTGGKIECIEAISEATKSLEGSEAYNTGAAMKYLWRWKRKNGVEDLKKARWHIEKLINDLENENG